MACPRCGGSSRDHDGEKWVCKSDISETVREVDRYGIGYDTYLPGRCNIEYVEDASGVAIEWRDVVKARKLAALPDQTHAHRVAKLRGDRTVPQAKPVRLTGKELAQSALDANVEIKTFTLARQGMFKPQRKIKGWMFYKPEIGYTDSYVGRNDHVLATDGAVWAFGDYTLEQLHAPDYLHDRDQFSKFYVQCGLSYIHMKQQMAEDDAKVVNAEDLRQAALDRIAYGSSE